MENIDESIEIPKFENKDINADQLIKHMEEFITSCGNESIESFYYRQFVRGYFVDVLREPVVHTLFIEGLDAGFHELYVAGSITFCAALETSLKFELAKKGFNPGNGNGLVQQAERMGSLTAKLLRKAKEHHLPINILAFEGEDMDKHISDDLAIINIRNAICHGHVGPYIQKFEETEFFTPECLRDVYFELLKKSILRVQALEPKEAKK